MEVYQCLGFIIKSEKRGEKMARRRATKRKASSRSSGGVRVSGYTRKVGRKVVRVRGYSRRR